MSTSFNMRRFGMMHVSFCCLQLLAIFAFCSGSTDSIIDPTSATIGPGFPIDINKPNGKFDLTLYADMNLQIVVEKPDDTKCLKVVDGPVVKFTLHYSSDSKCDPLTIEWRRIPPPQPATYSVYVSIPSDPNVPKSSLANTNANVSIDFKPDNGKVVVSFIGGSGSFNYDCVVNPAFFELFYETKNEDCGMKITVNAYPYTTTPEPTTTTPSTTQITSSLSGSDSTNNTFSGSNPPSSEPATALAWYYWLLIAIGSIILILVLVVGGFFLWKWIDYKKAVRDDEQGKFDVVEDDDVESAKSGEQQPGVNPKTNLATTTLDPPGKTSYKDPSTNDPSSG